MGNNCLLDFIGGKDDFSKLEWESGLVRQVDLECEEEGKEIFEFRRHFKGKRIPTKKGVVFGIMVYTIHQNEERESLDDIETFKKEQDARNCFEGQKAEMEWFELKNKEGKVFDGRRYMWKVKDGKLTGERGWD